MVDQQQLLDLLEYLLSKYSTSFVGTVSSAGIGKTLYVDIGEGTIPATSLDVGAPGEVAVIADSTGSFYCFKVGGVNLKRNRVITNRKFKYVQKDVTELDAAILYVVKETKSYVVDYVNPTWELSGNSTEGYVCKPSPEGDRGEYPDEATCMQQANEYWQELVNNLDNQYNIEYQSWQNSISQRNNAETQYPILIGNYETLTTAYRQNPTDTEYPPIVVTATSYAGSQPRQDITITAYDSYRYDPSLTGVAVGGINGNIRDNRRIFIENSTSSLQAPPPPARQPNPPYPIAESASNTALSFYFKKNFKAEPVKLLEINEKESFEAIVVKSKTASIAVVKTGRAKENEFILDPGGDSCGGSGGGTWSVTDYESWYKLASFDETGLLSEYLYGEDLSWNIDVASDYQFWRYSDYYIYPTESGNACSLGTDYLSFPSYELKERYEAIAKYQGLTNVYSSNRRVDIELLNEIINGSSLNITGGEYLGSTISENIFLKIVAYKTFANLTSCNKRELQSTRVTLPLPPNIVFIIAKGVLK